MCNLNDFSKKTHYTLSRGSHQYETYFAVVLCLDSMYVWLRMSLPLLY